MVEAIRAHQRRRLLLRVLALACCVGLLGYVGEGIGPVITIPGHVVARGSSRELGLLARLGSSVSRKSSSVRIETERGTFSWDAPVPKEVWVDAVVGRFSGMLHVRRVRPREVMGLSRRGR
jgi:hypothetical protein